MSNNTQSNLIATLITNPKQNILIPSIINQAYHATKAKSITWLNNQHTACDILLPKYLSTKKAYEIIHSITRSLAIDVIIQHLENRRKKLLLADMDSTIIQQECINELAKEANLYEEIANITQRAMNGEIPFEKALKKRVQLLKNLPITLINHILEKRITFTPGAHTLVKTMRANGAYTALISGGFSIFSDNIAQNIGFHENSANILEHNGFTLTGSVQKPILGKQAKLKKLIELCKKFNIPLQSTIAVGDGANDISMLQYAGSGIAFHAKAIVAQATSMSINYSDLSALLYIQGYKQRDFIE
ncbi:MAG: phosphoserine phosphatase [Candidatus Tokpelaia sp. JSC161]|jgi:phosphoserine phosphatase|nr:MAG: phosphoserine phosphatase [Candidatus Tokpelaia sp. JSC161]